MSEAARAANQMRVQSAMADQLARGSRRGIVTSYDPDTYSVKVRLEPEAIETGWVPLVSPWVGNGWGMYCPPSPGDQVSLVFERGDIETGEVIGALYSDTDKPLSVPAGEFWIVHESGAAVKFRNNGKLELTAPDGLTITGDVRLNGDVDLHGKLDATGDLHTTADVKAGLVSLKTHTHTGVVTGPGISGPPSPV